MKQALNWFALHGFVRVMARIGSARGDIQSRLMFDPGVRDEPNKFFAELQQCGPLIATRVSYLAVSHGLAYDLLRSDDFRSVELGSALPAPLRRLENRTRDNLFYPLRAPSLLTVEPPQHTRYRKLVSSVFTPRAVAGLRGSVEVTAVDLLDRLAVENPATTPADVVAAYCSQLPVAVISDILGVADADRRQVLEFGELAAPSLDIGLTWRQYRSVHRGVAGFNAWLAEHVRNLRRHPGNDLLSKLIEQADTSGQNADHLDNDELQAIAGLVLAAGFETTVNLLSNGIALLLAHPDAVATLRERPELWPNAVEEILRLESPVQLTARLALRDSEVAGTVVKQGELVVIYLAAANRDPVVFADPDRFDIERPNAARHLAFSGGRHFCLGAALARAEGEVGLRAFFERFPAAHATTPGRRRDTRVLRGWAHLPVVLGQTTASIAP